MKKVLVPSIIFIVLGFIVGNLVFSNRVELVRKIKNNNNYYFLEEGVYTSKETLNKNISKVTQKVISKINNNYYVYVGITKSEEIAKKIKELYQERGIKINIKERKLNNEEFLNNVTQFDILLNEAKTLEEIITIEKIILSNYDDLINNANSLE